MQIATQRMQLNLKKVYHQTDSHFISEPATVMLAKAVHSLLLPSIDLYRLNWSLGEEEGAPRQISIGAVLSVNLSLHRPTFISYEPLATMSFTVV